jgi:RNA polymerase sigma factor (sigma-70 family)
MRPDCSGRPLAAQSDQQLLALVRDGHERAFEALVRRYRRPLLRYCRRMHLSHARAEDVLQHAFLQAWLALAGGAQVRDLKPWLYRIVHNTAVNATRDARHEHLPLSDAAGAGVLAGELQPAELQPAELQHERRAAASNALSQVAALPDMQRRALVLSALDGQSRDEVASALGISDGAVRGLLYRARRTLRDAAAAIAPQPLIAWAFAGAGRVAATGAGAGELSGGLGATGAAGMLAKGAAVAFTDAGEGRCGGFHGRRPGHGRRRSAPAAPCSPRAVGDDELRAPGGRWGSQRAHAGGHGEGRLLILPRRAPRSSARRVARGRASRG